jgi:hypothetical protein
MNDTKQKSKLGRTLIWIAGILGGLVLLYIVAMNMMMSRRGDIPSDLDYSTTQQSEQGLFNVSYTASTGTIPINQMHQWTLHVERTDGTPVEDATITVDGDMPQHGHGMPTQPQVTENLGNGDYLVDGLRFQMGGWWLMDFTITAGSETDTVHFNMMLE